MDVAFDPGEPGPRLRGRQGRRPAPLRQELETGTAARRLRGRRTSPRSPSPAARRSSPPAATCWSTTAAAGTSTRPRTPCSTRPRRQPAALRGRRPARRRRGRRRARHRDRARRRRRALALLRASRCSARPRSRPPRCATAARVRAVRLGRARSSPTRPPTTCRRPTPTCRRRSCRRSRCPATATCCARPANGWRGRAAHRVRRLRRRPAGEDRPDRWRCCSTPPATAGRSAAGAATPTPPAAASRRRGGGGSAVRARVRTAAISRYGPARPRRRSAATPQPLPMPAGPVALRGRRATPQCEEACADLAPQSLGPDRTLAAALRPGRADARRLAGPRALLYTGNRVGDRPRRRPTAPATRRCSARQPGLPVFPALGSSDVGDGFGAGVFETAFAGFPAPFGAGARAGRDLHRRDPGRRAGPGARTHYAFDSSGAGRDRARDRDRQLAPARWPRAIRYQNPPEPQLPWLEAVLADARAKGIPSIVMGNRNLNTRFTPKLNVATDGDEVAQGAGRRRRLRLLLRAPRGEPRDADPGRRAPTTIPSFGTGTLGYRSQLSGVVGSEVGRLALRRRRLAAARGRRRPTRPGDQPRAGRACG